MARQLSFSQIEQQTIAAGMAERRLGAQRRLLDSARPSVRWRLSQHARYFMGRTGEGKPVRTFSLDDLKVDARDPANVRILFNREENLPEEFAEGQRVPRRQVEHVSDIFGAVRMLSHVSDGHSYELFSTNQALAVAERINAKLVVMVEGRGLSGKAIASARQEIVAMGETKRLVSAYSSLAIQKLRNVERLLQIAEEKGNPIMVSAACAALTAFRSRMGEWRPRQTFRIDAYNELRECSLRIRRDRYTERLLAGYARVLSGPGAKKAFEGMARDIVLCETLTKFVEQLPGGKGWKEPARANIKAVGHDLQEGSIKESLREAYRMANRAGKEEFVSFMRGIVRQLQVRNPRFIANELQKAGEIYLVPVVDAMNEACSSIKDNDPELTAIYFQRAAERIR